MNTTNINMKSENAVWHNETVTRKDRQYKNGHKGVTLWLTGLSGAGKSTVAHALEEKLHQLSCQAIVLDGDNVRHGLCGDLGFSDEDRKENIRRSGELSKIFTHAGMITLSAFISPFHEDREVVRGLLDDGDFIEVYCSAPLHVCEKRDVKGMYKKARAGIIQNYTGITSPYQAPLKPDLVLETATESIETSVEKVMQLLRQRNIIS